MPVRIRLTRVGTHNKPYFRVVAAERTKPRDGRFLEVLGTYNPKQEKEKMQVNKERFDFWLKQGATMSKIVSDMLISKRD